MPAMAQPSSSWWSPRALAWFGGAFIAAMAAQAGWDIWRGHGEALRATERDLGTQSRVIAEQTARSIQAVDVVLAHVAEQLERGMLSMANAEGLHRYLEEKAKGLVQTDGLVVFNAQGRMHAASQVMPKEMIDLVVATETPFIALREQARRGLLIDNVRVSPGTQRHIFPIGRRVQDREGRFVGVVGAPGRVEYFETFYRDTYPDPSTRISLVHRQGWLLARHPPAPGALGRRLEVVDRLLPPGGAAPSAVARLPSPVDGVDHFVALRQVPDYPLIVAVSRDAAAALAPWRAQALATALRTLLLGALAAALLWMALRQLERAQAARRSLEVSEERYALAMTGSDEGHWLWDIPARQVFVSARLAELFGIAGGAQVIAADEYFDRLPLHPEDRERVRHNREEHVAGRTPRLDHEFRIVMPGTGEVRWIHTRAQCFRAAAGQPLRLAGATVDATRRKRAEEALRESEARFAVAVAGADDGIWVWDFVKGQAFSSRRGRELLGLPPQPEVQSLDEWRTEMAGQIHPDDQARRDAAIAEHLAGRSEAYVADFRVRRPDGEWRWVHVHGRCERDAEGRPLRMAGSASDIDARKRAEEALRRSEEHYALAMAGSRGGHWVYESRSDSLYVSPALSEMFGLPPVTSAISRADWLARVPMHPDDAPLVTRVIADQIEGRTAKADYECRIVLPEGIRWTLTRTQRFDDADGQGLRVAGVSIDITERKEAEAERQRLEAQLRQAQKLEAIGTLAGGIAHDFNNILSAILGYGELAQRGTAEGSPQRRHIDATIAAAQRAKSLVERILAFSRAGMGERVPVHVQSVVDEALDSVAATLPAGVRLQRRLAAGDAGVLGDATQIHQVVMNLCANAVQAMRGAGRLEVTLAIARLDTPLAVATSTLPAGEFVQLAIADSGSGIEPALLERIFDPFFTTKEVGVGTGLGLSLVHGIVTELGGGIAVESRLGAGSRFTAYLPLHAIVAPPRTNAREDLEPGHGQTVLLVDDEEALVRLGEEALAELGYEPVGLASSSEALALLRADPGRFDLLLTDEAMPGLTGSELARAARALRPDLPIVLMSGFVTPALTQRARELGVAQVLNKPLAGADIARALAAALRPTST